MTFNPVIKGETYDKYLKEQQQAVWYYGLSDYGKYLTTPQNITLINMKLISLIEEKYGIKYPLQNSQDIREDIIRLYLGEKQEFERLWPSLTKEELTKEMAKFNTRVVNRLMLYVGMEIERKNALMKRWDFKNRLPKVKRAQNGQISFYDSGVMEVMGRKHLTHLKR
jgi:hypothetical protein